jgi:hypothetical protein
VGKKRRTARGHTPASPGFGARKRSRQNTGWQPTGRQAAGTELKDMTRDCDNYVQVLEATAPGDPTITIADIYG